MPELTATHFALLAGAVIAGIVLGWIARSGRSNSEKNAINAGWQEQLEAQRAEHGRLMEQNKSLMEQNSQYQASNHDSRNRASELSDSLREAADRRDDLQRQIKEIRSELETAVGQRNQLQSEIATREGNASSDAERLARREATIEKLSNELKNWQERVPPLVERFRIRNDEAQRLEEQLVEAEQRIQSLEAMVGSEQTRVEPVDPESLGDDLYASNDAADDVGDGDHDEPVEEENDTVANAAIDDGDDAHVAAVLPFTPNTTGDDADHSVRDQVESGHGEDADDDGADPRETTVSNSPDNLKSIKGIGPSIEKTLNEMGIWRFQQIADMSEYDIDRVARQLKGFRSRIYREDWIGQARSLYEEQLSRQA
ncbi:MAG: hypothetical protein AAF351_03130 [Pseudomonadota bacterium]